jgi:fermentation-respiration switch protein FrsA (DUF1100 family)
LQQLKRILMMMTGIYTLIVLALAFFQRDLLYQPAPGAVQLSEQDAPRLQPVVLTTADNLKLTAWYSPALAEYPTILHLHGNGGNAADWAYIARFFAGQGYGVLLVDYRGYGGNPGHPTEQGIYADGRAALAFLKQQGLPPRAIVLWGASLGTGVAVQLATEMPVGAVVLESPYLSVRTMAQEIYPWLPVRWVLRDVYDSTAKIARVTAPVLILHGAQDTIIPIAHGRTLFAQLRGPKQFWEAPTGGHNDLAQLGGLEAVAAFLQNLQGSRMQFSPVSH